jgi:hypothetical protein
VKSVGAEIDRTNARAIIKVIDALYEINIIGSLERDLQERLDPIFDMCQAMYSFWRIRRDEIPSNGR